MLVRLPRLSRFAKGASILRATGVLVGVAFVGQIGLGLWVYAKGDVAGLFLICAGLMMCLLVAPMSLGLAPADPFSPLGLATVSVAMGTGVRVPFLVFSDSERVGFLMFQSEFADLALYAVWACVGIAAFVGGYCCVQRRAGLAWLHGAKGDITASKGLILLALGLGAASILAAISLLGAAGIDLGQGVAAASRKAFVTYQTGDGRTVAGAAGGMRTLAALGQIPLILVLGLLLVGRLRWRFWTVGLVLFLLAPVVAVPFLTSSRSLLLLVFIKLGIVAFYFRKLRAAPALGAALAILLVLQLMGDLRARNQGAAEAESGVLTAIVESGNGFDLVRTAAIMDRVPDVVPHLNGQSYLSFLTFYIPRSIWPDKPDVALGPWVRGTLFQEPVPGNNGWPSGLVAEAYVNFGLWGVPIVMALAGMLARFLYNSVRPYLGRSVAVTTLYAFVAWYLGFVLLSLNLAHALSNLVAAALPLMICLAVLPRDPSQGPPT